MSFLIHFVNLNSEIIFHQRVVKSFSSLLRCSLIWYALQHENHPSSSLNPYCQGCWAPVSGAAEAEDSEISEMTDFYRSASLLKFCCLLTFHVQSDISHQVYKHKVEKSFTVLLCTMHFAHTAREREYFSSKAEVSWGATRQCFLSSSKPFRVHLTSLKILKSPCRIQPFCLKTTCSGNWSTFHVAFPFN